MRILRSIVDEAIGSRWLRLIGVACIILIAILSLTPGHWQTRTWLPGPVEHFVAYFGTAMFLVLGARATRLPILVIVVIVALSVFSGVMEVLQHLSPGRDPEVIGFVASSLGATVGAAVAFAIRVRARHGQADPTPVIGPPLVKPGPFGRR